MFWSSIKKVIEDQICVVAVFSLQKITLLCICFLYCHSIFLKALRHFAHTIQDRFSSPFEIEVCSHYQVIDELMQQYVSFKVARE